MAKKKQKTGPVNVSFADRYEGCQVVANIMGLNVETVRKRAKAGKIPASQDGKGTWIFVHADLIKAGIKPFTDADTPAPSAVKNGPLPIPVKKKNVTDVIFVLDRSGSMGGLIGKARESLDAQLNQLRQAAGPNDEYYVSVINFDTSINRTLTGQDVTGLTHRAINLYNHPAGGTRLYDAVIEAVEIAEQRDDGERAFLISVLTDGEENSSSNSMTSVAGRVKRATAKDRYTFVYAGPRHSESVALAMGIPAGNITTWDQTVAGITSYSTVQSNSLGAYTSTRSAGTLKSTSFYAQPVTTDAAKFAGQLAQLPKLNNVRVERVTQADPVVINKFCEKKFGTFTKGKAHYELVESEKVQDYKGVVIQDKTTGAFYQGWEAAKRLLGIPDFKGTVHIKPGNLGDFKVFIQSTSVNRKLPVGTAVVYLP